MLRYKNEVLKAIRKRLRDKMMDVKASLAKDLFYVVEVFSGGAGGGGHSREHIAQVVRQKGDYCKKIREMMYDAGVPIQISFAHQEDDWVQFWISPFFSM